MYTYNPLPLSHTHIQQYCMQRQELHVHVVGLTLYLFIQISHLKKTGLELQGQEVNN